MKKTITVTTRADEFRAMEGHINALSGPLKILEAGCGRKWPLKLSIPYTLSGIDTDEKAVRARQETLGDLKTVIVGDLVTAEPSEQYDVIYCSYVMEHVQGAQAVLDNFVRWIRPNGLIILRIPNRHSVFGFLARHTPHWLHVFCVRYLMGLKNAGKPGFAPYPVVYDPIVCVREIKKYCAQRKLTIQDIRYTCSYSSRPLIRAAMMLGSALSLGRLSWRHNNVMLVIRA